MISDFVRAEPIAFANISALTPAEGPGDATYELTIVPFNKAVQQTVKRLDVAAVHREADLIELTCSDRTPAGTQWLCEAIAESYLSLRAELQQAEATAAAEFLAALSVWHAAWPIGKEACRAGGRSRRACKTK